MMAGKRRAVITDIDNTLYNFVDFFGPAFRALMHVLVLRTGLSEPELLDGFRTVYAKYQSLEYPYSIQELEVLKKAGLTQEELTNTIHAANVAFGRSRHLRLHPYEGVKSTLAWLKKQGYFLIAYTDGPAGHSRRRLFNLGIEPYFDLLIAWGPTRPDGPLPFDLTDKNIQRWFVDVDRHHSVSKHFPIRYVAPIDRKPNPNLLGTLANELGIDCRHSWLVGDSIAKDLVPARAAGLQDVFAQYGKKFDQKNWETLVRISPWHDSAVRNEVQPQQFFTPQYTIEQFSDLRDKKIVPEVQLSLL